MADDSTGGDASHSRRRLLAAATAGIGTALAGCAGGESTPTPSAPEGTVTVRLTNRDDVAREYEVVVNAANVTDRFSGVLAADESRRVEMVASFRIREGQYEFSVSTPAGRTGRTWDPNECGDLLVDAAVEGGEPEFETSCQS